MMRVEKSVRLILDYYFVVADWRMSDGEEGLVMDWRLDRTKSALDTKARGID
jgi:hypothetical protein